MLREVHRRYNPLRDSWVLVSPHRTQRPWQGQEEAVEGGRKPAHDAQCYLCPGNQRSGGMSNPPYASTYVFRNDFAAVNDVGADSPEQKLDDGLLVAERVNGECLVVCFSPNHGLTLAEMSVAQIGAVVDTWTQIYVDATRRGDVKYCQIFENKGSAMGCSNPHPHGQCWLTTVVPDEPQLEHNALAKYFAKKGTHLLEDYVAQELRAKERVVDENDTFVVVVPFWATWPFETLLVAKKRVRSLAELTSAQRTDLAAILQSLTVRYDNLFQTPFPYSMGIHQAFVRNDGEPDVEHLLFHFYPPLLRSATVRKFLVGFELLGMPQRDITPELAAARLREQPTTHYLERAGESAEHLKR